MLGGRPPTSPCCPAEASMVTRFERSPRVVPWSRPTSAARRGSDAPSRAASRLTRSATFAAQQGGTTSASSAGETPEHAGQFAGNGAAGTTAGVEHRRQQAGQRILARCPRSRGRGGTRNVPAHSSHHHGGDDGKKAFQHARIQAGLRGRTARHVAADVLAPEDVPEDAVAVCRRLGPREGGGIVDVLLMLAAAERREQTFEAL